MSRLVDELGERMKAYEGSEAKRRLDLTLPVCARIDGRSFSKFTKGFKRPFDDVISKAMRAACARLIKETHAKLSFVQSDEINLIWQANENGSIMFDGRLQKTSSVLASIATSEFTLNMLEQGYEDIVRARLPVFDARVWQVPSRDEASNVIVWRSQDARKNGVSSACRSHISAKAMHGLNQSDMLAAMAELGTDYHATYPASDRYGVYMQRKTKPVYIEDETWANIPEANKPEDRTVLRGVIERLPVEYFGDVKNRVDVIFDGADPIFFSDVSD
ncbi:MAG: tRNA(His) guanylyltransferase Thg1 family protein [Stappiaceae bacterium]